MSYNAAGEREHGREHALLQYDELVGLVRSALHNLYDPDRLRRSALANALGVANRAYTPAALQRILTEAIQALEPGPDDPAESRAWRIYDVLVSRYVRGHDRHLPFSAPG